MSNLRAGWILGVWTATFVATAVADGVTGSGGSFFTFVLVIVSILPMLLIHEGGHALAAMAVGYKVKSIQFTKCLDGWTEWECPPGRETLARNTISTLGGPALTLIAAASLFLVELQGSMAAWRAGLATFAFLWTADLLAPIPRDGIARDGWATAESFRLRRARRGELNAAEREQLDAIDAQLLKEDLAIAFRMIEEASQSLNEDDIAMWAALLSRSALGEMMCRPVLGGGDADEWSAQAVDLAPNDPVAVAVTGLVAMRIGASAPSVAGVRPPTKYEAEIIGLAKRAPGNAKLV